LSSLYGSVSPIAGNLAGNRAFNKTTIVQIDSAAEQDKNIFRSGIKSGKRRQSAVNSGLKIKLKAQRSSNGPEDNPSNNINLFTQEADIKPEIRKKNYNTGD
jgi:hypothetical protein